MITTEEIKSKLWRGANDLRGSMDASNYKNYMLGLMFYKFLSDKTLETYRQAVEHSKTMTLSELLTHYHEDYRDMGTDLEQLLQEMLGYCVLPQNLYHQWLVDIQSGDFELQQVMDSLNSFERSIAMTGEAANADDFKGLFSTSIIDLTNTALGSDLNKRSKNIRDLILLFADLNMVELQEGDVLGDAYEYLIGMFASDAGKKAGEFYTPRQVSEVMAQIVAKTTAFNEHSPSIYDPTVGSASLLLTVKSHLPAKLQRDLNYFGQEYITETYNLARMNLLLHGVRPHKMTVKNGNTLAQDWPEDPSRPNEGVQFDVVVMNPPYSDKKWNQREDRPLKVSDPRFAEFGVLPPEAKGDFAYLMHGLYHLGTKGTMAIVLPHGVLFRGGAEGEIRKRLLEKNQIDAVIGLPSNLFTNTGIPVCVLILKKNRTPEQPILIVDASHGFAKVGKQNVLQEKDIAKIVDTYVEKIEIAGYSHLANYKEIRNNDYNLNIPRYVTSTEAEIPHDVEAHLHGGIPVDNLSRLTVLNQLAKPAMKQYFEEIRPGYVQLTTTITDFKEAVHQCPELLHERRAMEQLMKQTAQKWYQQLKTITPEQILASLKENMLQEIKEQVSTSSVMNAYDAYQIGANLWEESLTHDTELIVGQDFYELARTREPNMIAKGTGEKRRFEQDGWNGVLVPSTLVMKYLFQEEEAGIQAILNQQAEAESRLSELVEAAKVEESVEYETLYEAIKKDENDEPKDSFELKVIKAALKTAEKNSQAYKLLSEVQNLLENNKESAKQLKEKEKSLKEAVEERILTLTNDEIDKLMFEKWFGTFEKDIVALVDGLINKDLQTLEVLENRYHDTIDHLDNEIAQLESEFEKLLSQLIRE